MEEVKNFMYLKIMGNPENISLTRLTIAAFASQLEFTLAEIEEIKVVVSETVSNCIIHAYQGKNGLIEIEAKIYQDRMELVVIDQGKGIKDIELAREPSYTTDPERMGLGLAFVDSFMDRLEIISAPGQGTKVIMVKYLQNINDDFIN